MELTKKWGKSQNQKQKQKKNHVNYFKHNESKILIRTEKILWPESFKFHNREVACKKCFSLILVSLTTAHQRQYTKVETKIKDQHDHTFLQYDQGVYFKESSKYKSIISED